MRESIRDAKWGFWRSGRYPFGFTHESRHTTGACGKNPTQTCAACFQDTFFFRSHIHCSMESRPLVLHWTFDASESAIDVETGGVAEAACHVNCMLGRGHGSADGTGYFLLDGGSLSLRRLYREQLEYWSPANVARLVVPWISTDTSSCRRCRLSDDTSRMLIRPCDENGRDYLIGRCTSGEFEGRSEL